LKYSRIIAGYIELIRLANNVLSVEVTAFGIQREPLSDNSRIVGDSEVIIHDDGDF